MASSVRVRFAPSPTGYLHVGGLRTALYNFLFARKNNGKFILRIEDTDRARYVDGAVEKLIDALHWAGIDYDEGPNKNGDVGPYIQSERLEIYRKHVEQLLQNGKAYHCFCASERLEQMRKEMEAKKVDVKYDRTCLKLSEQEIQNNIEKKIPFVVRMKIPEHRTIAFHDIVRGDVEFQSDLIDDQVLLKSDGFPTYHLAVVVDDHLMEISHVIRGEEWLSSVPKHLLLYEFFGWEVPQMAHLPLLLNPDKSKLSKRQGDVAVEDYRDKGYLKEALVNFVALLGWNPGTEQDIFSMEELIEQFSLERVHKSGAVFNLEKLNSLNATHLRKKSDEELLKILKDELAKSKFAGKHFADEYLLQVVTAMRERVTFVKDFIEQSSYFFEAPTAYDETAKAKNWKPETSYQLKLLTAEFSKLENPKKEDYEIALHKTAQQLQIGNGKLIHGVRLAISGVSGGPGLYDILSILGKEESMKRIYTAIETIK
ncbi:MAG: glutamate--tRNA ligase [Ignavibacteriales bacterium]|nr:glutamate--tRNA ligase [Ignavibacteriales bacterium]